ncbi:hypothetical protein [Methylophaga thiooxydans]|nr:hypothetical protein [Methylophaga thiooxydans]
MPNAKETLAIAMTLRQISLAQDIINIAFGPMFVRLTWVLH